MLYTHVAVGAVALVLGFGSGWKTQGWRWEAADGRAATNAQAQARLQRQGTDAASQGYEVVREKVRTEFVPIKEYVEVLVSKPEYERECLTAEGVDAINAAVRASLANPQARPPPLENSPP